MTLVNYEWKQNNEDEKGYYFVLTDTLHHLDYNVVLIKDDGSVMVDGNYINTVSPELAAAIAPRIDYFIAMNKAKAEHHTKKDSDKKDDKKSKKKDDKKKEKK